MVLHYMQYTLAYMVRIQRKPSVKGWLISLSALLGYALLGAIGYLFLEDWTFVQGAYFAFTIISTVGYGCMSPTTYPSRVFTMIYTVVSVPVFAAALSNVTRPITDIPFTRVQKWLRKIPFFDLEHDDPLNPVSATRFYVRGLAPIFMYGHLFACFMTSLLAFAVGQADNFFANTLAGPTDTKLNYFDALYFTAITSSTVGFGDICPQTDGARIFTAYMASYGISIINLFVVVYAQLSRERERMLEYAERLNLEAQGEQLIDQLDVSGDGVVDRFEYVIGMLQTLNFVEADDVKRLLDDFDRIDTNGDGSLTREDIKRVLNRRAQGVKTMALERKHTVSGKDSTKTMALNGRVVTTGAQVAPHNSSPAGGATKVVDF